MSAQEKLMPRNASQELSRRRFIELSSFTAATAVARANGMMFQPRESAPGSWREAGVLDLRRSPYAKLHNVPVHAVTIVEGFWSRRRTTNVNSSMPSMYDELIAHGRMTNFERLIGKSKEPQKGKYYSDSDMYKWAEAVGWALQSGEVPELRRRAEAAIAEVVAIQEPSGYLNTYYQDDRKSQRMVPVPVQTDGHEMYCLGHMLQAAIGWYRSTGDRTLLDAGILMVDKFVLPNYGPGAKQTPIVSGHPEIEMALIELYRTTGDKRHLELAGYILQGDPRVPLPKDRMVYMFCGIPFTSRTKLEGHAVRAMYACCGATDYFLETGDPAYWRTLETLWNDLSAHQMYITGGVGARSQGEAFGEPYELPNARAYGESCAAIGNMMWNWRMLAASGQAKYVDVIERALYNGINSGMSLDGRLYCYRNPLAFDPATGDHIRNPWYDTTCCPPNIERTLASLPGYFFSTSKDGVYVHLYDNAELNWHFEDGTPIRITQQTRFPWAGDIRLTVTPAREQEFTTYIRIPSWSRQTTVKLNGEPIGNATPGEYLAIRRRWPARASVVEISFDMRAQQVHANPAVADDRNHVAIQRGPLIYCMEGLDQKQGTDSKSFPLYQAQSGHTTEPVWKGEKLDGIMALEHQGSMLPPDSANGLYAADALPASPQPAKLQLIPYYAWANRDPSPMQVWIPLA
jgi:DUF1680 family protein